MHNKIISLFLYLSLVATMGLMTSCGSENEEDPDQTQFIFDPRQPGKSNDELSVRGVQNLQFDVSVPGKVSFTWEVIPLYNTLDYSIEIYRKRAEGGDEDFDPIDPANSSSTAFLYLQETNYQSNQWVDENVLPDTDYIYFFFVKIEDFWSPDEPITVTTPAQVTEFSLPTPSEFWKYDKLAPYGQDPLRPDGVEQEFFYLQSLKIGESSIGNSRGSIGLAYNGSVMYVPDTETNRVVIYAQAQGRAIECVNNAGDDEFELLACNLQFSNMPLEANNVLGQPKVDTAYACGEDGALPMDQCLTAPTHVVVEDGKMFISDSGNNRIIVWNRLPIDGCDPNATIISTRPTDCVPDAVIGRSSLFNEGTNPNTGLALNLAVDGKGILCRPGAVTVYQNDLFIPDTCHHRVVMVRDYANPDAFLCSDDNWLTELCSFNSVLGQEDFNSVITFKDLYEDDNLLLGGPLNRTVQDPEILKRKFAFPNRIRITKEEEARMLVSVNEDFVAASAIGTTVSIKGRIMIFDPEIMRGLSPTCNNVTFANGSGSCDAIDQFGIENSEEIILLSSASGGAGSYPSISFALEDVADFDVDGDLLMAVDSVNNYIYVWDDWKNETRLGKPYKYRISDPAGALDEDAGRLLPDLGTLSGIEIDMVDNSVYVIDSQDSRVYKVLAQDQELDDLGDIFNF